MRILLLILVLLVGCGPRPVTIATPTPAPTTSSSEATPALELELREVTEDGERLPRPAFSPLAAAAVEELLASLEPLPRPSPSPTAVAKGSPPPVALRTPPVPPEPSPGPVRFFPEGDVKFADRVAVSFGAPVAPLGAAPPTDWKITPDVPGSWRWLGTRTLLFEPKDERFAMATEYAVAGPDKKWRFSIPPPELETPSPTGPGQELTPTITLVFNQRVKPLEVLKFLSLREDVRAYPLRLLSPAETAELEPEEVPGTRVAVKPEQPLPSAREFKLYLKEGLPSAEGPLTKPTTTFFAFRTYDPLKLTKQYIDDRTEWSFIFNNPLDSERPAQVKVEPELPGLRVQTGPESVMVTGEPRVGARYRVTFVDVQDVHGQKYAGEPVEVVAKAGEPRAHFMASGATTLEPDGPGLELASDGYSQVKVERYALTDEDVGTLARTGRWTPRRPPVARQTLKLKPQDTSRQRLKLPRGQWYLRLLAGNKELDRTWVQVTGLHAVVWRDSKESQVWVTRLKDSRPVEGARVNGLRTDGQGLAVLPYPPAVVRVQSGTDVCFAVPPSAPARQTLRWYVADDRSLYRPGETVHVHGWVRRVKQDLELASGPVRYDVQDAEAKSISKGKVTLHGQGGFELEFKLPPKTASGTATLALWYGDELHHHNFQVEEFRRSDFEVSLSADPRPVVVGSSGRAEVLAQTFSGGSLAGSQVNWDITAGPSGFAPPGWEGYCFGGGEGPEWRKKLRGSADQQGSDKVELAVKSLPPVPYQARLTAEVQDLTRQTQSADTAMTLLPAEVCLGLRGPDSWLASGEECMVQAIVTDPEGKAVSGRSVTLRWLQDEKQVSQAKLTSGDSAVASSYTPAASGELVLEAETQDAKGRAFRSRLSWWVGGNRLEQAEEGLDVQLDKMDYAPGDKATLQVRTQLEGPAGMVVVRHGSITQAHSLAFTSGRATLELPLTDADIPGLQLDVAVRGRREKEATLQARSVVVPVSSASRELKVKVTPQKTVLAPGGNTSVDVVVTDAEAKPVTAELWAVAVDESVLAAASSEGPGDPVDVFYAPWHANVYEMWRYGINSHYRWNTGDDDTQIYITGHYGHSDRLIQGAPGYTGAGGVGSLGLAFRNPPYGPRFNDSFGFNVSGKVDLRRGMATNATLKAQYNGLLDGDLPIIGTMFRGPRAKKPRLRKNFTPLALATRIVTDAEGHANIPLKLPDSLTRYKVIVVAASGARLFGRGEASVTAALPLNLRLSAPRFARRGDRFELVAVLANQGVDKATVRLALRGTDLPPTGCQLELKPDERAEVAFPVESVTGDTALFQAVAVSGQNADQTQVGLPVQAAATRVEVATYGKLDKPEGLKLDVPEDPTLTLELSGTPRGQIREAVRDLVEDGLDTGTRAAAIVLAGSVWPEAVPRPAIETALARLKALQGYSGGISEWSAHDDSNPFLTLLTGQALAAARRAGHKVDVKDLTEFILKDLSAPSAWSESERLQLQAYRLDVLRQLGRPDAKAASKLAKQKNLPLAAAGWLLPTLPQDGALKKRLLGAARDEAGTASFATGMKYDAGHWVLASDQETDAVLLSALLEVDPKNRLIVLLARGLARPRPRSETATALAVAALSRLDNPKLRPTDVWAGSAHVVANPGETRLPSADTVVLGASKLYYRLGAAYATPSPLPPADLGFALERRYEAVDDNRDVVQSEGTWKVKPGSLVRVRLTLVAPTERFRVALVDPVPAGLEVVNPAVAGSSRRDDPTDSDHWWFGHYNLRDDRVEAFAESLPAGVYIYSYLARATTSGTFQVPPASCHEQGAPEVSGRTGTEQVQVGP